MSGMEAHSSFETFANPVRVATTPYNEGQGAACLSSDPKTAAGSWAEPTDTSRSRLPLELLWRKQLKDGLATYLFARWFACSIGWLDTWLIGWVNWVMCWLAGWLVGWVGGWVGGCLAIALDEWWNNEWANGWRDAMMDGWVGGCVG